MFVRDGQRIVEVAPGETKTVILSEGSWGFVSYIGTFGGNLYVVDSVGNEVFRYPALSGGRFGYRQNWVQSGSRDKFADLLSRVVSMSIDGSLWIGGSDGSISKFTSGTPDFFSVRDLDKPLSDSIILVTRQDLEGVYVLDHGNSRVVVFGKTGNFIAQYIWDGFERALGLAVSEEKKKIVVFLDNKVYTSGLKHLD